MPNPHACNLGFEGIVSKRRSDRLLAVPRVSERLEELGE
jgi:hypothetical protein